MSEEPMTSRFITFALSYCDRATRALQRECGLNLLEYRIVSFLGDCGEAVRTAHLAQAMEMSLPSITVACEKLEAEKRLVRTGKAKRNRAFRLSEKGKRLAQMADRVLEDVYDDYFSPLSSAQKSMIEFGSAVVNRNSREGNRVKGSCFFPPYETLHAFLHIERLLTTITKREELSLNGFRVLFEAAQPESGRCLNDLAGTLLISPPNLSFALDRLQASGLVRRMPHPFDKRKMQAIVTVKGLGVLERTLGNVNATLQELVEHASAKERTVYRSAITASLEAARQRKRYSKS